MKEKLYTVNEIVDKKLLFGYKRRKIFYLINAGELKHVDISQGKNKYRNLRISESSIDNFVSSRSK